MIIALLLSLTTLQTSSDTLTLAELRLAARGHFPLRSQVAIQKDLRALALEQLDARFLPQLSAAGRAAYHSDVPELPIEMPGFSAPSVSRDQYELALGVEQLVFDGGRTAAQRALEVTEAEISTTEVNIALHSYLAGVEGAFFGVLMQQAAEKILMVHRARLEERRRAVRVQADEGMLSGEQADALSAEILQIEQQIAEVRARRTASRHILSELTGVPIGEDDVLAEPSPSVASTRAEHAQFAARHGRPEGRLFELQKRRQAELRGLAGRNRRPSVSSFGTAALGRPQGMNIFENDVGPYFAMGMRVRWSPWDWGTSRREQRMVELRARLIDAKEDAFTQELRTEAEEVWLEIERLRSTLATDREIIRLRERVAERAARQLKSGTISTTEYLMQAKAEQETRLAHERRRLELAYAKVRYLGILGDRDANAYHGSEAP